MLALAQWLRRASVRRALTFIAVVSLFAMSAAQAAHSHRIDAAHPSSAHVECLFCMHADRLAAAPDAPRPPTAMIAWSVLIAPKSAIPVFDKPANNHRARGPPDA